MDSRQARLKALREARDGKKKSDENTAVLSTEETSVGTNKVTEDEEERVLLGPKNANFDIKRSLKPIICPAN